MCDFILNASYLGQLTLVMSTFVLMIMVVEEAIFGKTVRYGPSRSLNVTDISSNR